MKKKIGIIGYGFVGKAVEYGFKNSKTELSIVDPAYPELISLDKMMNEIKPEFIFICVPTPMKDDGSINSSIVEGVLEEITRNTSENYQPIVILKSSVTPDIISSLEDSYSRFIYNPEFLTERNANSDFVNAEFLILGGKERSDLALVNLLYLNNSNCRPDSEVYYLTAKEASFVKYANNCFLASKVIWMNQFYEIVKKAGCDFTSITEALAADTRIGSSHLKVPGNDDKFGFSGSCYPKDVPAFLKYCQKNETDFSLLRTVFSLNQQIRSQYELSEREKEQNIGFDINL